MAGICSQTCAGAADCSSSVSYTHLAYAGLIGEQLPQERIDEIKSHIITLSDEKKLLLQQHKILKSKKTPVSYLSAESDRLAFGKKIESLERVQNKIAELRKARNSVSTRKSKWEHTINELRSLNRTISCGELRCMDCLLYTSRCV